MFDERVFNEGAKYALTKIQEVFGEEITKTDIWKEFFREEEREQN